MVNTFSSWRTETRQREIDVRGKYFYSSDEVPIAFSFFFLFYFLIRLTFLCIYHEAIIHLLLPLLPQEPRRFGLLPFISFYPTLNSFGEKNLAFYETEMLCVHL